MLVRVCGSFELVQLSIEAGREQEARVESRSKKPLPSKISKFYWKEKLAVVLLPTSLYLRHSTLKGTQ